MTRINVVPVQELCDQHLLAEHRELTRIPNCLASGKYKVTPDAPEVYTLGTGHVRFFFTRLKWLKARYNQLHNECKIRGFNVSYHWPDDATLPKALWGDYKITAKDLQINNERITLRWPVNARYCGQPMRRPAH